MNDDPGSLDASAGAEEYSSHGNQDDLPLVPLFPLPNVVLLPRAVLPLHIFEERYKTMTRHALEGDRQIAMALLRPGWEKSYYGRPPIESVVCVGTILSAEELPDGNFNFLLQGTMRGEIVAEVGSEPYRLARVRAIRDIPATAEAMSKRRRELIDLFTSAPIAGTVMARQFTKMLATRMPTAEIADLAAFTFIEDASAKQSLLADADVERRVGATVCLLEEALRSIGPAPAVVSTPLSSVNQYRNPSLN